MELGEMECENRAEYRPVYSGSRIHYQNISGPKTLMMAWKKLIDGSPEFRKESENHLRGNDRFLRMQNTEQQITWNDQIGDTSIRTFHEDGDADDDNDADCFDSEPDIIEEDCSVAGIVNCRHVRKRKESSLHIPVKIAGHSINALIDTGATTSFIQSNLIKKLGMQGLVELTETRVRLADDSVHPLSGHIQMNIEMGGNEMEVEAYVIDGKRSSFVLGHPLFYQTGWLIDLKNKRLLEGSGKEIISGGDKTAEDEGAFYGNFGASRVQVFVAKQDIIIPSKGQVQ